jgi:hypothetical protein
MERSQRFQERELPSRHSKSGLLAELYAPTLHTHFIMSFRALPAAIVCQAKKETARQDRMQALNLRLRAFVALSQPKDLLIYVSYYEKKRGMVAVMSGRHAETSMAN